MGVLARVDEPGGWMSRAEYRLWAEGRPGRFERINGQVVAMAPERVGHARIKGEVFVALRSAIAAAGLPCEVLVDGPTIEVGESDYEPDVIVRCGTDVVSDDSLVVPDATVIVPYQTTARARYPGTFGLFTNYAPVTMPRTGLSEPARLWSQELMRRLGRWTSAGTVGLEALYGSTWLPGDAAFPISTLLFNSFGSDPSLEARVRDHMVHWPAGRDFRFQLQITLKTSGRRLFVEMGYRSSVYTEVEIEHLAAGLLDEMSSICRA